MSQTSLQPDLTFNVRVKKTEHIDAVNHYPTEYFQRVDRFLDEYVGK
ncbi:hypothetical protein [Paenibacillus sp. QZ-Y1]